MGRGDLFNRLMRNIWISIAVWDGVTWFPGIKNAIDWIKRRLGK